MRTGRLFQAAPWPASVAFAIGVCLSLGLARPAAAQFSAAGVVSVTNVKVDGLSCSTALGSGTFGVTSWSWGEQNQVSSTGTVGKVSFNTLQIAKSLDACSPALALGTAKGNRFLKVTLTQYDKNSNVLLTVLMESVLVSAYSINGVQSSEAPVESVNFSFTKITVTHASGNKFTFDTATNTGSN